MTAAPSSAAAQELDQADADQSPRGTVARFLRALHEPGDVFELRLLDCPGWIKNGKPGKLGTWSGHYRDPDPAAADVVKIDAIHRPRGCYVTANPTQPDLLARGPLEAKDTTTSDADVTRRRWLPVDLDPERPAKIAATDKERAAALALADHVRAELAAAGWPAPMRVGSGNGALLLYRVELPNDSEALDLLTRALAGLAARFNTPAVHVDLTMHNAARIIRLPGTMNRKGTDFKGDGDIPARPHRPAELLDVPEKLVPVSRELLEAVAVSKAPAIPARPAAAPRAPQGALCAPVNPAPKFYRVEPTVESVRRYLEHFGATIKRERDKGGHHHFYLDRCPITGIESGGNGTDVSVSVGGDVIAFHNLHNRGQGLGWVDLREHYEPGYRDHAERMKARGTGTGAPRSATDAALEPARLVVKRAADLMQMVFAPLKWIIPGVLPEGYAVLAGRPKLGKSYLALDFCLAVAAGGYAIGERKCERRRVLYCGLEDGERRLQKRMREVAGVNQIPELLDYLAANELPRLHKGGLEALDGHLQTNPDTGLVVIDTYAKVRPPKPTNADPYQHDYDNGAALADLARKHGTCVLAVLHARKAQSEDFIDEITGTLGIAGAADAIMVMRRARGSQDVAFHITGKDVPEQGLSLRCNWDTKAWTVAGDLEAVQHTREVREVLDVMQGGKELSPAQIAALLGVKVDALTHRLRKMLKQGVEGFEQARYGKYRYIHSFSSFSSVSHSVQSGQSRNGKSEQNESECNELEEGVL